MKLGSLGLIQVELQAPTEKNRSVSLMPTITTLNLKEPRLEELKGKMSKNMAKQWSRRRTA